MITIHTSYNADLKNEHRSLVPCCAQVQTASPTAPNRDTIESCASKKDTETTHSPSFLRRVSEWLYSLFWGSSPTTQSPTETQTHGIDPIQLKPQIAQMDPAELESQRKVLKEINRHLYQVRDSIQNDADLQVNQDVYLLRELMQRVLSQKELREEHVLFSASEISMLQKLNKANADQTKEYLEEISKWDKFRSIPEKLGIASNIGLSAAFAAAYATGGIMGAFSIVIPILGLARATTMALKAYGNHKNEKRQAEYHRLSSERDRNSFQTHSHVDTIHQRHEESMNVAKLLKSAIKNHQNTLKMLRK